MRTTIRLNDNLLKQLKKYAADTGQSMTGVIEDALREKFHRKKQGSEENLILPTFSGNGLKPGVDLDDSPALRDLMDT